jgi:hypothetical protein
MSKSIDFKVGDVVFIIDMIKNSIITNKKYIIRNIEFENGDNWNDALEETYYGYLEDIDTKDVKKMMIVYKHFGYNWNYVFISKTTL